MDEDPREPEDDRDAFESPPDGATCAEHPERMAIAVCPRCGAHACVACWHHAIRRCHACLMRDPGAAAPPIPWEERERGVASAFLATLGTALRPDASAPALARGSARDAVGFALASFLPFALLGRQVAYTHTLLFEEGPSVSVLGGAGPAEIAIDLARAAVLGLALALAMTVALGVSYRSLASAFGHNGHAEAPLRVILYRGWLLPASLCLEELGTWIAPGSIASAIVQALPLVLLFSALRATARMGSGAGPFAALVVVLVPFFFMLLVAYFAEMAMAPLLPSVESIRAAMGTAAPAP